MIPSAPLLEDLKTDNPVHKNLEFLSEISHEIRNPVNALVGISSLLRNTSCPKEQEEYMDIILQTSENLLALVNNVMDFSKLELGKISIAEKPTDLRQALNRSLLSYKAIAASKGLEILIDLDDQLPAKVLVDSVKFSQIFINLVSNALKFTEEGQIRVKIEVIDSSASEVSLSCSVADTGIGMDENTVASAFEAFIQGSSDINLKYGGTGLGLSICKNLIHLMGGQLKVESQLGKGSSFSFEVVLKKDSTTDQEEISESKENSFFPLEGIRVLVADDNKINLLVARKHLELWKAKVVTANNGLEVLDLFENQNFDLVLLDQQMPLMNGTETAREIRKRKGYDLPILSLSCFPEDTFEDGLINAAFNDCINKPFHPSELFRKILTTLKMPSCSL